MYPTMVTPEYKKIERYIWGLPERIQGNVTSLKPAIIHEAIFMAHNLMDQVVRAKAVRISDTNKRKWEDQHKGHLAKYDRGKTPATGGNTHHAVTYFGCGEKAHYRNKFPKRKDPQNEGAHGICHED
ncbi:hypothetical protein Tco_1332382 [Tanacetum coccineum]